MPLPLPTWALRAATAADYAAAARADQDGTLQIGWPPEQALRTWAKQQAWPRSFFNFKPVFVATMLQDEAHFVAAVTQSGIELRLPKQAHQVADEHLRHLDDLYAQRTAAGFPAAWGALVEELRDLRRAIEAGVVVFIAGEAPLTNWETFYQWAHGRYHMLEDGYDKWIGDDG